MRLLNFVQPGEIAAPEGDDQVVRQGECPAAQEPCGSWRPGKRRWRFSLPSFVQSGMRLSPSLPGFERSGRRCRSRCPLRMRTAQGIAKIAPPEGHDQIAVQGERPAAQGCEGVAEPDPDAGAQLARLRATGAVLSKALFGSRSEKQETPRSGRPRGQQRGAPGHGRTRGPGSRSARRRSTRRRRRVCAPVAASPMRRSAPISPRSSRSTSRPTSV